MGTVEKRRKETKKKQETEEEEGDKEQNLRGEQKKRVGEDETKNIKVENQVVSFIYFDFH